MSSVVESLFILSSVISILNGGAQGNPIQADCVTPVDTLGMCVDVKYCVSIMTALINNDHLTNPEVAQYLRESQCGLTAGSQKVCCTTDTIDFGGEPYDIDSRVDEEEKYCGELAEDETPFKWIAELWFEHRNTFERIQLKSKCLGTLISMKHVIVPAHCVASLPANISLAHITLQNHEYKVSKIFIHASYNQPKFANDIAIIELDADNDSDNSMGINNAICLETSTTNAFKSTTTLIMKRASSALKYGKIEFISDNQCSSFFDQQQFTDLTAGQFCANIQSNDTSPAEYSPFIGAVVLQSNNTRRYALKGFTSTSIRTQQAFDESRPYVFTDMEHHLSWIRSVIREDKIVPQTTTMASPSVSSDDGLKECQLSSGGDSSSSSSSNGGTIGKCVNQEHCTLFRDAPRPLSTQQEAYLEQIKCNSDEDYDDEICCPLKYINQTEFSSSSTMSEIDENFRFRRGAKLLDMQKCGRQTTSYRIVGGKKASLKEFPWFGLIKYRVGYVDKFTCGSSLISSRYVLTCAHCITNLPQPYRAIAIRLGEYDLRTNPDCSPKDFDDCNPPVQDIEIEKLIPHAQYNQPRYSNDIGLVRLAREPEMSVGGITPICLPINAEMRSPLNPKYIVTGFGLTEHGSESDVLLKIFVPKVEKETCQSFHRSLIRLSEGHECYGGEGIIDSCKGDSGGPAMNVVNSNGKLKMTQFGIVAAGHSSCGEGVTGFPGIYTSVEFYMDWILDNMED